MVIAWLIGVLLCAFIFHLAKTCKIQKKTRKDEYKQWSSCSWEDCEATIAYPRVSYLLFALVSMVPILNIVMCAALIVYYTEQYKGPGYNTGDKLVALRLVVNSKVVHWLMEAV